MESRALDAATVALHVRKQLRMVACKDPIMLSAGMSWYNCNWGYCMTFPHGLLIVIALLLH